MNMRKQNLIELLKQYSAWELKIYEKYDEKPSYSFSEEYRKKMLNLKEQSIHQKNHTFVYQLAMACACIIMALLIVNQASAYVFGMTLWDKLMEPAPEEMVTTVYQGNDNNRNRKGSGEAAGKERVHDIPTEIPEGYELVEEENTKKIISMKWQSVDNSELNFSSYEIKQDIHMYDNGEWETEEAVVVAGYTGRFYAKSANSYLYWDDDKYRNSIISTAIDISKSELLTIAEGLYKK